MEPETTQEDHRVRVARERRKRMKAHLLNAVMAVCADGAPNSSKVIDDVIDYAEVSRGTFYKYFTSLDEAIAKLVSKLAEEMTLGILPVYSNLEDPRQKTATGSQIFMRRAMLDPHWGGFIARIGLLTPDNVMIRYMMADIEQGMERGLYSLPSVESGLDLLIGTKVAALRRITKDAGDANTDYPRLISSLILRGLGVPLAEAEQVAVAVAQRLDAVATPLFQKWMSTP